MTNQQDRAIINFFKAVSDLQKVQVSRSSRYLGDIGEFLCGQAFPKLVLSFQLREPGYDAILDGKKVQIKFHNSPTRTNIDIGDPNKYDVLLVVIGPESRLKGAAHLPSEFRIYSYSKKNILGWDVKTKKYYCAQSTLRAADAMKIVKMSADIS